jgi:hypothetical protein
MKIISNDMDQTNKTSLSLVMEYRRYFTTADLRLFNTIIFFIKKEVVYSIVRIRIIKI